MIASSALSALLSASLRDDSWSHNLRLMTTSPVSEVSENGVEVIMTNHRYLRLRPITSEVTEVTKRGVEVLKTSHSDL